MLELSLTDINALNYLKENLDLMDLLQKTVSQLQSMLAKSVEGPSEFRYGLVVVDNRDGTHFVTCANLVDNSNVPQLKNTLDQIHNMDEAALKKLYKQMLRSDSPDRSKGAGVGFIDIARKATKFEYDFVEVSESSSYFSLTSYV